MASCFASTNGLRSGRIITPVPSLMRLVAAAIQVSHTSGSGMGTSGVPGILPDG